MKDFYINSIKRKKKNHSQEYLKTITEVFGEVLTLDQLREQDNDKLIKAMYELEKKIKIKESIIDVKKMANAIQFSRSGAGLASLTEFTCAFCGNKETWANTHTPEICYPCAEEMAKNIAYSHTNIVKGANKDEIPFDRKRF